MKYTVLALILFICAPAFSQNLFDSAKKAKINKTPLTVEQPIVSIAKDSNQKAFVTVHLKLAKKHKSYDSVFKISSKTNKNLKFSSTEVSPLQPYVDKFNAGKERMVMADSATMRFFISSNQPLSGDYPLTLTYQACTTDYCLLPQGLDFTLTFPILEKQPSSSSKFSLENIFTNIESMPLWLILLATYLFGFLTSLTPCVFPMIPITLGILGFSETSSKLKGFTIGLSYALGLAITYALVGVAAAMTGGFVGQALANPYIVWGIFFFYVFTAFSMAGFFTIKAPSILENQFSKIKNKGLLGAFAAGAIAGIIASPCVGPAVAAVLAYVAQTGSPTFGFSSLFMFGMGLGTLFILIGTFYGQINSRLKPGPWLNYVKYILAALILIGALLFIKPHISFLKNSHTHSNSQDQSSGLWTAYSTKVFDDSIKQNKAIIIDFRADWCAACHELDLHTFSKSEFAEETKGLSLLKFDATKPTEKEQNEMTKFEIFGLPTVLFIDANGKIRTDLTLTGFEEWPEFQKRLQALKKQ